MDSHLPKQAKNSTTATTSASDSGFSEHTQDVHDSGSNFSQEKTLSFNEHSSSHINPRLNNDPLLDCLLLLSQLFHQPTTPEVILSGLAIHEQGLTAELFERAAKRAQLTAKHSTRRLQDIANLSLPAVLLLNNQQACILTQVNEDEAIILQPESGGGKKTILISELNNHYSGHCFFVEKLYRFDQRSNETIKEKPRHWFWDTVVKAWPIYSEVLVASFFINLFALAPPLFIMNVYDRVVPNHSITTLWVLASGVFIVFCFDFIMKTLRSYFVDAASKKIDINLSSQIFEQILAMKMSTRPHSVGALSNMVHAFELFRDFITSATMTTVIDLPFVLLFIFFIASIGGPLAWVPIIIAPTVIIVDWLLQAPLNRLVKESYKHAAEKQATLYESINGIEAIKGMGAESTLQQRWERIINRCAKQNVKLRFLSNIVLNFSTFMQYLANISTVILGVYLITNGQLTMGGLIACTILTGRALAPMTQIANLLTRYHQSKTALESLHQVMLATTDRNPTKQYLSRPQLTANIRFKEVSFTYPQQSNPALRNINLDIQQGEHIAIIGRIGSGKTTIEKLLLNLYQADQGIISIDNTEINQLDPTQLRHQIAYVPQEIELFYGSIRDNIVMGAPYIDDAAISTAVELSTVSQFLAQHPDGLDRNVGERGQYISGGQRQCIAIARALLLQPNIIIMDEPTNAMDDKTELMVKNNLKQFAQGKTMILVTHHASLLSLVNRIIVMDQGRIVADGSKEQILTMLKQPRTQVTTEHKHEQNKT